MAEQIMPLLLYNFDCPICGGIDSIDIETKVNTKYIGKYDHIITTAVCTKCNRKYAMHYEEKGNYLSDFEVSMDRFVEDFVNFEQRNLDEYLEE